MAINRIDPQTVQNISDLSTIHVSELEDGAGCWVIDVEARFVLIKNSGLTPDGVTIVAPLPGSPIAGNAEARWIREEDSSEDFQNQIDWHINALTGNDQNDGKTEATALRTYAELKRRVGVGPFPMGTLRVFFDSDIIANQNGEGSEILVDFILPDRLQNAIDGSGQFVGGVFFFGKRTVSATGTVGPVQIYDPVLLNDGQMGLSQPASTLVGKQIILPDRAPPAPDLFTVGYVIKDLGGTTGRYSPFFDFTAFAFGLTAAADPTPGEAYTIFDLGPGSQAPMRIATTGGNGLTFFNMKFEGIDETVFSSTLGAETVRIDLGYSAFFGCIFSGLATNPPEAPPTGTVNVMSGCMEMAGFGCSFESNLAVWGGGFTFLVCCVLFSNTASVGHGSRLLIHTNSVGQGGVFGFGTSAPKALQGGYFDILSLPAPDINWFATFDQDFGAICGRDCTIDAKGKLWGTGIAVTGIVVDSGGSVFYNTGTSAPNYTGQVNDTNIGGTLTAFGALPFINPANNAKIVVNALNLNYDQYLNLNGTS